MEEVWSDEAGEERSTDDEDAGVKFSLSSLNHFCPDLRDYCDGVSDMSSDFELFNVFPLTGLPILEHGLQAAGFHPLSKEERERFEGDDTEMQDGS